MRSHSITHSDHIQPNPEEVLTVESSRVGKAIAFFDTAETQLFKPLTTREDAIAFH